MSDYLVCPNCLTENFSEYINRPNDKRFFKGKCQKCNTMLKFKMNQYDDKGLLERDNINFTINGQPYTVGADKYPFTMTLNEYLRNIVHMTGTKVTCREGGCGSCVINVEIFDHVTKGFKNIAINTCLFPLYSSDGLKFTTVEGVGSKSTGFNEIQKRLVDKNGTQCGWCSPGMVMNMYSLLLENSKPTKTQIESSFDGNICRCTGYRSILDAMKSFSADDRPIEIEELNKLKCLNNDGTTTTSHRCRSYPEKKKSVHIINDGLDQWFIPNDMDSLLNLLETYEISRIVSGNTGTGVYKYDGPYNVYIDPKQICELYNVSIDQGLLNIGSQVTLKKLIDIFNTTSSQAGFEYLSELSNHVSKIANMPVRNLASWAGNLVMKHNHLEFPSDVFLCFETVGAVLKIVSHNSDPVEVTPSKFLNLNLNGYFLYSVSFVPYDAKKTVVKTYKIMPRSQSAHAYVNAGFRFDIDPNTFIVSASSMVFGGLSPYFIHATDTEQYLSGKALNDQNVLNRAFQILFNELFTDNNPANASPTYLKSLALSLFYKYVLYVNRNEISARNLSALESVYESRGLSSGIQSFPTNPSTYPVSKPMSKLNAALQTSGEAQYTFDQFQYKKQLEGAFIVSTIGACRLGKIDTNDALEMPGVVKILFAKDIMGKNSFIPTPMEPEKLFADDFIDYAGQAIGLVVAQTFEQARKAAKAVKIEYVEQKKPILTIADAIKASSFFPNPMPDFVFGNAETAIVDAPNVLSGECNFGTQFHFYMENQNAIAEPNEDGFDVSCSTQWIDFVQNGIAQVLGLSNVSSINVRVKQLGGAYGGKITRANMPATAAALAAKILNRPVRVELDLNTNMEMVGKRFPWYFQYKIGYDNSGNLLGIILNVYEDLGNSPNDNIASVVPSFVDNTYKCKNWHITFNLAKTNLPANTSVRSPGFFPSIAIMETMIEHVAKALKADPLRIRTRNYYQKDDTTPSGQPLPYFNVDILTDQLLASSDYQIRAEQVTAYNASNRWKKKGLSMTPIKWGVGWNGASYNCIIAIYASDGSVSVSHGGVEMGQGIHTKVAQVCAYELDIPIESISIKSANNLTNANAQATGGSITSELVSQCAIECCKIINTNLDPIRKRMPSKYTWQDLIAKALQSGVDLTARYWIYPQTETPFAYNVYGVAVSEAVVDVLTGETQILRSDILYDGGQSLNGEIDIGQAEGAFVMGMGFWLFEKAKYDPNSGASLTNGTWEYHLPTAKDIPADFRITFQQNNPNPVGVFGSKCIGEPPLCLTPSVAFAVKRAVEAARAELAQDFYFALNAPATVESIQQLCLVDYSQFKLD